jgi:DnaK suppressor protein
MKNIPNKSRGLLAARKRRAAYLRGKLLEKRRKLLENLQSELGAAVQPTGLPGDVSDLATSTSGVEESYRIGAVESNAVAEIDHALQRLESGKYGVCEDCGKPIPAARLEAVPFAYLCVPCKEREERERGYREEINPLAGESGAAGDEDAFDSPYGDSYEAEAPVVGSGRFRGYRPSG